MGRMQTSGKVGVLSCSGETKFVYENLCSKEGFVGETANLPIDVGNAPGKDLLWSRGFMRSPKEKL